MDFESLKNQVSNLTLYDLKAGVRKVQNGRKSPLAKRIALTAAAVMNLTEMEAKVRQQTSAPHDWPADVLHQVREATNADPWGAPSTLMMDIAHGTHN